VSCNRAPCRPTSTTMCCCSCCCAMLPEYIATIRAARARAALYTAPRRAPELGQACPAGQPPRLGQAAESFCCWVIRDSCTPAIARGAGLHTRSWYAKWSRRGVQAHSVRTCAGAPSRAWPRGLHTTLSVHAGAYSKERRQLMQSKPLVSPTRRAWLHAAAQRASCGQGRLCIACTTAWQMHSASGICTQPHRVAGSLSSYNPQTGSKNQQPIRPHINKGNWGR
jgi:hypothetical protein